MWLGGVGGEQPVLQQADLLAEWGEAPFNRKDLNCDGTVNGSDVGLLLAAWGDCPDDTDG